MKRWLTHLVLVLLFTGPAVAETTELHCGKDSARALVLSGGGAKGAFEAGAVFHLVAHRYCDFMDISGVSVGALNGAFLAEASASSQSLSNLQQRVEDLVEFWLGIKGPQDILEPRFLGKLRLFIFGLDSLNDFTPLERIIGNVIHPTKIRESKRSLRIGVVSFYDGVYHEIDPILVSDDNDFRKYVYASAAIPVNARMPRFRIAGHGSAGTDVQFADGGISHATPLASYFSPCDFSPELMFAEGKPASNCVISGLVQHHEPIKELFVIIANPYNPATSSLQTKQMATSNGSVILDRTLDLLTLSPYRWDLNFALTANRMLEWRSNAYDWAVSVVNEEKAKEMLSSMDKSGLKNSAPPEFPVRSANPGPNGFSLPYTMSIIAPSKVYADTYAFDPDNIRLQLYKGCVQADYAMVNLGKDSMRDMCKLKFPINVDQLKDDPDPPLNKR